MKLFEYEAKQILTKYRIPTPKGGLATSPVQAGEVATQIGGPVVVKAQILVAGRAKAGGILFAESPKEAEEAAAKLLGMKIKSCMVQSLWVEEKVAMRKELYFGVAVDRANRCHVAVASSEGGVEIEEVAEAAPERIIKIPIDPAYGFHIYQARQIAKALGYEKTQMLALASLFLKHYKLAMEHDAELAEMNPLIERPDGSFVAADARLIIDDNALYRHPEFDARAHDSKELTPEELKAQRSGVAYVRLEGDIGIVGNGAGLVMATLDVIQFYGGKPANFLDVGGGASADTMAAALDVVLSDSHVKVVFVNILGGITRCDEIAKGILNIRKRVDPSRPIVIRLVGTNEDEGRRILTEAGIQVLDSMEQAASTAVEMAKIEG